MLRTTFPHLYTIILNIYMAHSNGDEVFKSNYVYFIHFLLKRTLKEKKLKRKRVKSMSVHSNRKKRKEMNEKNKWEEEEEKK